MSWISRYYDRRVAAAADKGLLWQVGHTEDGRPISDQQFFVMLDNLRSTLDLQPDDRLLDLCCGNGIFTRPLSEYVQVTVAFDFSAALIANALANSDADNISYQVGDAKAPPLAAPTGERFNKVLMNAALQHFSFAEFESLLCKLVSETAGQRAFLFAFVPDADRRAMFEASLKPSLSLRLRRLFRRDLVQHWYSRDRVSRLCASLGLGVEFLPIDPSIKQSSYRFNILIR